MRPSRRRSVAVSVLSVIALMSAGLALATPAQAADTDIKINEVESSGGTPGDWIELVNPSADPVDVSGWILKDSDDTHVFVIAGGTTLAAGDHVAFDVESGFGLGSADSARVFLADGVTLIDSYSWTAHAGSTYGRCPDGVGDLVTTTASTKGALNACPVPPTTVAINEFSSNNPDFIELINTGAATVDLGGWVLKDNTENNSYTFPAGSSLAPGEIRGVSGEGVEFLFGLGNGDTVRLLSPSAVLIDSYAYPAHPPAGSSYGRCPNGTGDFGITAASSKGSANGCATATPTVKVNEVESNGDAVADWVELKNLDAAPADISGWKILDGDPAHAATPVVVPANTVIPAGGYYAIYTEIAQSPGFGLGVGDSVTLLLPDGTTQVDTTTWGAHPATTWGRCPDGTGTFRDTTTATRGVANACSPVRLNEIESETGTADGWVELVNISGSPVDVSGWAIKDNDDTHSYAIPAGTSVPANGYQVLEKADFGFALDSTDSVRLYDAGSSLVESYGWSAHATQTYGRCKDGVGDFKPTLAATKGASNSCPGLDTLPWPGSQTVATADLTETFLQDLSGLAFDPSDPDVLWASQNKKGTLFRLARDGENWVPDAATGWDTGKDPKYPGGTGSPDTEGITIGPDGFVYLASERDNEASGISRMSILRYDPTAAGATVTATNEWNLTAQIPAAGANLGLEGISWVPDNYLVDNGFVDQSTGAAYEPADYPLHGTGLFLVAVENTGNLHAFALDSDGVTSHLIATVQSGFEHLADVTFDPELGRVWAVTDDTHDGKTALLKIDSAGAFVVDVAYDRPAAMPNLNNEGFAVAPRSRCVDGLKEVLWSDDGDTDGHSIRRGAITCTAPEVAKAATTTDVVVAPTTITATVTVVAPGSATPTGVVDFRVDGTLVGTAPVQSGVATLDYAVPTGGDRQVEASYSGDPDLLASSGTAVRRDPTITAAVTSTIPKSAAGWYRTPVTVTFTCSPNGAALTAACPGPVTRSANVTNLSVTRSITAIDGGAATVSVTGINIDRTPPAVRITGVQAGKFYIFRTANSPAKCVATDALSGVASCTINTTHRGRNWTSTATATDLAGNVTTKTVRYFAVVLFG